MKSLKNDPVLAGLPSPVTLTPDQLASVAADTSAMLGAGGGVVFRTIIAGPMPVAQIFDKTSLLGISGPAVTLGGLAMPGALVR